MSTSYLPIESYLKIDLDLVYDLDLINSFDKWHQIKVMPRKQN